MKRRAFVKFCTTAIAGVTAQPELLAADRPTQQRYAPARLVDARDRQPVRLDSLEVGETYLFHYPYVSTPCFLIDLGRPVAARGDLQTEDGQRYRWRGGAGPNRSVVAFSAICAHRMSHPARSVSFINYRHDSVRFRNSADQIEQRGGVIYCCSENSVYDPATGCSVLGGPAPQPLAAIDLEYDAASNGLIATGTVGGEMFQPYFAQFGDRLVLEYRRADIDQAVGSESRLMRLRDYTRHTIACQA